MLPRFSPFLKEIFEMSNLCNNSACFSVERKVTSDICVTFELYYNSQKDESFVIKLPVDKRDVILLSYFLGMTDRKISDKLNIVHTHFQAVI